MSLREAIAGRIVRPGYDHALLGHEMGHNFGSGHSDGGVNASWRRGARDFFKKIDGGETSAKKMYNHAKSRLGTAPLRHPEQIPSAKNDFARTSKNKVVTIEPLRNDLTAVVNGQENRLSIAELGAVFPIGAGSAGVLVEARSLSVLNLTSLGSHGSATPSKVM